MKMEPETPAVVRDLLCPRTGCCRTGKTGEGGPEETTDPAWVAVAAESTLSKEKREVPYVLEVVELDGEDE